MSCMEPVSPGPFPTSIHFTCLQVSVTQDSFPSIPSNHCLFPSHIDMWFQGSYMDESVSRDPSLIPAEVTSEGRWIPRLGS